ncbi:hypothetical protein PF008_g16044 [Phytophthora fragariae]|uniref:DDE Tnp4 domain-containing protein n=1 Tax=Phytophthora fragariae TaxID=53985 RepID=A0A6G0RCU2_9STRA|nr:hypothetical protein PF008_g16044 [Phytophthora fragariae]
MAVALMDEENDELLNDNLTADSDLRLISDVDDVSEMLQLVQSSRYLVYRERAISATQFHADIFLQTTPNSRFRTRTRMDKDSFKLVVDEIKDNPVFYNRSPFAQAPVWLQLAVALDRFGHYGSGASLNRSQELWDIRKGTADDYTDRVFKALNELSSRGENLLADSAYPADLTPNTIVPAYKSKSRGTDIADFNTCVSHARVVNEHTIGVFKNRWGSLKELRTQLNGDEDMNHILKWMSAYVILHNMLIEFNDEWSDDECSSSEEEDDIMDDDFASGDNDPFLFRRGIKRRAIRKVRQPGGILWLRAHESAA